MTAAWLRRAICLAPPEAAEKEAVGKEAWETPAFRIRDRIVAMVDVPDGRAGVWCKAPSGAQAILVTAAPERFFRPPYVGHKGWIGCWLDGAPDGAPDWVADWAEIADLIGRSYRMTAPRRLLGKDESGRIMPRPRKAVRKGEPR